MKSKIRGIILVLILIAAVVCGLLFYRLHSKFPYNEADVNGNLPGNLYNSGSFCESGDFIYFCNPQDNYSLYSMNKEGGELTKLTNDYVTYINADDNFIYYIRNNVLGSAQSSIFRWNTNSLCRISKSGGDPEVLENDPCIYACLSGNYLYYVHYSDEDGSTLYKINIDGTGRKEVMKAPYIMCDAVGKYIYFSGVEQDHNIYRLDTSNDNTSLIYTGNTYNPILSGDSIYFMDCDNNYALAKVDTSTGEKTIVIPARIDCYNINNAAIFYQKNDPDYPELCKASLDGSSIEVLAPGNYTELNLTSDYLYFKRFHDDSTIYRMSLSTNEIRPFEPGVIEDDE